MSALAGIDIALWDLKARKLNVPIWQLLGGKVRDRVNVYACLEVVVSYPVLPIETTPRRTRILQRALMLLNKHPEKAQFPAGTGR